MQNFIFTFFALYTLLLFIITWLTSRKANNDTYFIGNRKSPWLVVAYGMIGASLSGVTFMSVPGDVKTTQFTYFAIVLGYVFGYLVIAYLLLPLYYKLNLTSIYQFLGTRFGNVAQKTGSMLFIISRLVGSALRMYLVIFVLQIFIFDSWNIPFWLTSIFLILIIFLYTFKGGLKTVVWTDIFQTTFFLAALVITIWVIFKDLNFAFSETLSTIKANNYLKVFNTDWKSSQFYLKQIFGGMFITITMTGLDQDMMQKNLSCKTLKESQRNMFTFTGILVFVNALFLLLGALLLVYAQHNSIDLNGMKTDQIYPFIALNYLGKAAAFFFVFGLISAGFSSADGTFTALTTSFCLDILNIQKFTKDERLQIRIRKGVHILMSILFLGVIIVFSNYHNEALIRTIFKIAGYTYGPILGLFAFGMFTKRAIVKAKLIPVMAILTPSIVYTFARLSPTILFGYQFGFELIIVNGALMFGLLYTISCRRSPNSSLG